MGWSGGNYTKGNAATGGWTGDASLGIGIEAGRHDTQDNDFASGIDNCIAKDGQNFATADLPMNTKKHTNVGNASARNHYAAAGQVQDGSFVWLGTTGGTSTAFTVTATPTIIALTTGAQYVFKANAANGAAATLKIDGTTATVMQRQGTALVGNEFKANDIVSVVYDGTNFQITNIATAPLYVDRTNGRVGIGTTVPTNGLNVVDYTPFGSIIISALFQASKVTTSDGGVAIGSTNGNAPYIAATKLNNGTGTATPLILRTDNTDRVYIGSTGNVGIGTSGPSAPLHVITPYADTEDLQVGKTIAGNYYFSSKLIARHVTASAANVFIDNTNNVIVRSTSSLRYKHDVRDYDKGLKTVESLRPVYYKGINDGEKQFAGLIAEEVEQAGLTEFVVYDDEDRPDALHYGNMIALSLKAIQELNDKVKALEARLAKLELA